MVADIKTQEQENAAALNQSRLKDSQKPASLKTSTKEKMAKMALPEQKPISTSSFLFLLVLALINDIGDWLGLDAVLFRGSDLFFGGTIFLYCFLKGYNKKFFKPEGWMITIVSELIPGFGDIMTSWTIFVIYAYHTSRKIAATQKMLIETGESEEMLWNEETEPEEAL